MVASKATLKRTDTLCAGTGALRNIWRRSWLILGLHTNIAVRTSLFVNFLLHDFDLFVIVDTFLLGFF